MFVFTARLSKRRLTAAILALVVLAAVIVIMTRSSGDESAAAIGSAVARTNGDRVKFLNSLGWVVDEDPIDEQAVVIPKSFPDVYQQYNELQLSQGFDLRKFSGLEAMRYTYSVKNYPSGDGSVVADIIVYRGRVIAGDIQSVSADGFMTGLSFPENGKSDV